MSARAAFTTRAFELWTHTDDIRGAVGARLTVPPAPDVHLMADTAVRSVTLGLQLAGIDRADRTVRVVLTGTGGGAWIRRLGPDAPEQPDTLVVADTIEFCRMAAQRLGLDDLPLHVDGDTSLARDVLLGVRIFAA
jgi:hypothetical protein